jgi:hypothetical protein
MMGSPGESVDGRIIAESMIENKRKFRLILIDSLDVYSCGALYASSSNSLICKQSAGDFCRMERT